MFRYKVFKTVKLGTGLAHAANFQDALVRGGFIVLPSLYYFLGSKRLCPEVEEKEIDLVVISAKKLGFTKGDNVSTIFKLAKKQGLALCPPEVGPQLRLQYTKQPIGEKLIIGSELMLDRRCVNYCLFYLGHDQDGLWVYLFCSESFEYTPEDVCHESDLWVFVLPRK